VKTNKPVPDTVRNMSSDSSFTDLKERVLLAVWRLKGIGNDRVKVGALTADPTLAATTDLVKGEVENLRSLGFLEMAGAGGQSEVSLTPLGLALLRQIEEDKLQELK
jgi:hypothetical protein